MAELKYVIVLANSIKHAPSTCIAGREIISGSKNYQIGGWVRPISRHGEGELYPSETQLGPLRQPRVMDFLEIPLEGHAKNSLQPENWFISPGERWKLANDLFAKPGIELLTETPQHLWLQPQQKTDRVSADFLKLLKLNSSLYLVQVTKLRVKFFWKVWAGEYSRKRRVNFRYCGVDYDLGLTDPVFVEKYRERFPTQGESQVEFDIEPPGGCCLCVSLAPEFNGYHYKVVATIIEAQ